MRHISALRTAQDSRTARSLPVRLRRGSDQETFARLTELTRERARLLGERDVWQRKLERISRRLAEIDAQVAKVSRLIPAVTAPPAVPGPRPRAGTGRKPGPQGAVRKADSQGTARKAGSRTNRSQKTGRG